MSEGMNIDVGKIIKFGHYPQSASGTDNTEIEWLVLDVQCGKALVISHYGLVAMDYDNNKYPNKVKVTWETCTLRAWLNDEFINKAFTAEEQKRILTTAIDNSDAQCCDFTTILKDDHWCYFNDILDRDLAMQWAKETTGGNNTRDNIFLLSYAEAKKYLGVAPGWSENPESKMKLTEYAIEQGAHKYNRKTNIGIWWLRSPGIRQDSASYVNGAGGISETATWWGFKAYTSIRPAFWMNLEI